MLLSDLFDLSLRGRAGAVGLVCDGPDGRRELTFGEIADRAARVAAVLRRRGLEPGDRLAVQLPNRLEFIDLFLACVQSGVVLVPINVLYREREIAHIVEDAEPKLIVATEAQRGLFPPGSPVVDVDELMREAETATGGVPRPAIDGDAPAAIVYTSGTTGRSKGAVLTHNNFAANAAALVTCWRITSADRYLAVLPLFHVHGLGNGVCAWLASGCLMRLTERFEAAKALEWFQDFQPTLFFGVPTVYVRLLELPADEARAIGARTRLFVSGSAPLSPQVLEQFRERFGHTILERYGMSETLMLASNLLEGERRAGTVGYPLPGVSLSVRDRQGQPVTTGDVGEGVGEGADGLAWLLGEPGGDGESVQRRLVHDRGRGRAGRRRLPHAARARHELIISGGFNIYPREIEEVLLEQPGVREAAVVGAPDARRGEVPVAYVVTEPGVDLDALRDRCAASLASFKTPRAVHRVDALPRNAMGKLQKHLLTNPPK